MLMLSDLVRALEEEKRKEGTRYMLEANYFESLSESNWF